jgi:hypothetical protein
MSMVDPEYPNTEFNTQFGRTVCGPPSDPLTLESIAALDKKVEEYFAQIFLSVNPNKEESKDG